MGLQGYVGDASDARKIRALEAKRAADREALERARADAEKGSNKTALREFGAGESEAAEAAFKAGTVGLVTREQFLATRDRAEAAAKEAAAEEKKRKRREMMSSAGGGVGGGGGGGEGGLPGPPQQQRRRLAKDPTVRTDFLPDADEEAREATLRAALLEEFEEQRERAKAAPLEVVFSYWDGAGHRRQTTVAAGSTIGAFLGKAR